MINLKGPLVLIELRGIGERKLAIGGQCAAHGRIVLFGYLANSLGDRADSIGGNDIARKDIGHKSSVHLPEGQRIIDGTSKNGTAQRIGAVCSRGQQPAQIAIVHFQLRHGAIWRAECKLSLLILFEGNEEKGLVPSIINFWNYDWAPEATAIVEPSLSRTRSIRGIV